MAPTKQAKVRPKPRGLQAGWTVPTVTKPVAGHSSAGYYSSIWTGIGGPGRLLLPGVICCRTFR